MITGKAGHKEVAHAERIYAAKKVSSTTVRRRAVSVLNSARKSIMDSYAIGLKDYNRAVGNVHKAKTPAVKRKAEAKLKVVNAKLEQLEARRKKADALLRQIRSLK